MVELLYIWNYSISQSDKQICRSVQFIDQEDEGGQASKVCVCVWVFGSIHSPPPVLRDESDAVVVVLTVKTFSELLFPKENRDSYFSRKSQLY